MYAVEYADVDESEPVVMIRAIRHKPPHGTTDEEQQQLGSSQKFWDLVAERRRQPTVSRAELEQRLRRMSTQDQR